MRPCDSALRCCLVAMSPDFIGLARSRHQRAVYSASCSPASLTKTALLTASLARLGWDFEAFSGFWNASLYERA